MLLLQKTILEMIARGDPLKLTMEQLCLQIEARITEALCSIVATDVAGLLQTIAAPGLSDEFKALIDGVPAGPMAGLCGSAVFHNQPVSVTDIATDPRWEIVRPEALHAGLAACWSNPIVGSSGMVLGAFALYFREARGPSEVEQEIVRACLDLAAIALERQARVYRLIPALLRAGMHCSTPFPCALRHEFHPANSVIGFLSGGLAPLACSHQSG